jgi:DNA methyltransferase 1-associated protein 1
MEAFRNPARSDDLVLQHWRRQPAHKSAENGDTMDVDTENKDPESDDIAPRKYEFAKYNLQVEIDSYTDEQYEKLLRDDDWSKEETDYLVDMVKEYYQRWPLIADRWEYQPPESSSEPAKERSIEDMKKRFYTLRAKLMELRTPRSAMTPEEFSLFETLMSFDAEHERTRKQLALALFSRTSDEIREEQHLLTELQRITMGSERMAAERADTRAILDAPVSSPSAQSYSSSAALHTLFQQLFQTDRSRKRGGRLSLTTGVDGLPGSAGGTRDSIASAAPGSAHPGRGSGVGVATPASAQAPSRAATITAQQEARFSVSAHERLSSGVVFRSDRVLRLRQAKSQIQTQKIGTALAELGVPDIIQLPTPRVCDSLAGLVGRIVKALELRKAIERAETDVAAGKKAREARLAKEKAEKGEDVTEGTANETNGTGESEGNGDAVDADADGDIDADASGEAESKPSAEVRESTPAVAAAETGGETDRLEPPRPGSSSSTAPTRASRKRSASVLSTASNKSARSKRSKK